MKVLDRFDPTEIASLRERGEFFWLDLLSPTDAELAELARILPLPALAAEDSREFGQRARSTTTASACCSSSTAPATAHRRERGSSRSTCTSAPPSW